MKVTMIGAGGWGTAMVVCLAGRHDDLVLYCRKEETAEQLRQVGENKEYLPGVRIPRSVKITSCLETAADGADVVILATPSKAVKETTEKLLPYLKKEAVVVCAAKGLADKEGHRLSEVIKDILHDVTDRIVVLSGPNHAEEVGKGLPAATVVASEVPEAVEIVQDLFMSPVFRVYRSHDIRGVEYGGALKNIIALACGVLDGLGLGDNSKAALMTRGLVEMTRFGVYFDAKKETFSGLSGMGDLVATCSSTHSRNHAAGILLGKGKTAQEITEGTHMVVEGMRTAVLVNEIAHREHIEMPVTEEVCKLLEGEHTVAESLDNLMNRAKKAEIETYLEPGELEL